jgi:hypothetical protein
MAESTIKPSHMQLIVDRVHEGRCVPFLGAAANVSSQVRGYKGLPLGADVAGELVKQIQFKGPNAKDLARVALQYEFETDRPYLINTLKTILPDMKCTPSPLLEILARLPFKLVITTNYDRLLERALEKQDFKVIFQPTKGFEDTPETKQQFEELEEYNGLMIYKIHGTFFDKVLGSAPLEDEEMSPLIITEDDYIEFLTVVGKDKDRIGVPNLILKKIIPSTLLFLGYSLEDWDFRTIYKGLIEPLPKHQARKSFAIQKDPSEFWVEFWQKKGVEIYNLDLYDFAEQLETSYLAKYGQSIGGG